MPEQRMTLMMQRTGEKLEHAIKQFPKYHKKILLGDFKAKDISKPKIWSESLHEINNDNGVREVNFAMSKNLIVKSKMFPHRNIHKFALASDGKIRRQICHILIEMRRHLYPFYQRS
jgi:hypothetical protein